MSTDPFSDPPTISVSAAPASPRDRPKRAPPPVPPRVRASSNADPPSPSIQQQQDQPARKPRRSMSQDDVLKAAAAAEKARRAKSGKSSKKGGLHVDVIDRLDYSGVGPATFHHDGPFDACAPSRNRHRNKAPMLAWTPSSEKPNGQDGILGVPTTSDKRLSPLAQATINAMAQTGMQDSPYGAATSPTGKKTKYGGKDLPTVPPDMQKYYPEERPSSPKRRETLAEAWGKGEPEPFEEFFAGTVSETGLASAASSIYNNKESHGAATSSGKKRPSNGVRRPTNRPPLPPPKPIFPPEASVEDGPNSAEAAGTTFSTSPGYGGPKRSKSLIHRIKKMREQPNVPVGGGYEAATSQDGHDASGSSDAHPTRPTHRSQNSLLGKFGGKLSPTSPSYPGGLTSPQEEDEKSLPLPPGTTSPRVEADGYFGNAQLGRKTSLMQKVRGAVVGRAR